MPSPERELKATTEHKIEYTVTTKSPDWTEWITLLTPILTFLAGYFLNKLVEDYKEYKRLNQVEKYYFSLLNTLTVAIDNQADALDKTIENLKALKQDKLMMPKITSLQTSRITSLPDIDLYKAFILRKDNIDKNNKHLTNVAIVVDFINAAIVRIELLNQEFAKNFSEYNGLFSKNFKEILTMKEAFRQKVVETNGNVASEIKFIIDKFGIHIANHQEKNGRQLFGDPYGIYNNFINPLFEDLKTIEPTAETYPFMSLVDNCKAEFLKIFALRDRQITNIATLVTDFRNSRNVLIEAVRILGSKE